MSSKLSKAALMIIVLEKDGEKDGLVDSKCCEKIFSNGERMIRCRKAKKSFQNGS